MQAGHSWKGRACRHLANSIMVATATHLVVNRAGQQQNFIQNAAVSALGEKAVGAVTACVPTS